MLYLPLGTIRIAYWSVPTRFRTVSGAAEIVCGVSDGKGLGWRGFAFFGPT